jgi:cardiolipin synthase
MLAGLSDGVDGFIARHFNQRSELGSWLDPVADKFLLVACFIMLGWLGALPSWLVLLAVSRDG